MQVIVATIGAAKGLKGEVKVAVRTDVPEARFAVGNALETDPPENGPLTVARTRAYKGDLYVVFEECSDRTTADSLRGTNLVVETDEEEPEEDAYYESELVGLEVLDTEGYTLGMVSGLELGSAQDLLVVREPDGKIARVPFVKAIVTEVDLADNCVVMDPPPGLFSDDELETIEGEGENAWGRVAHSVSAQNDGELTNPGEANEVDGADTRGGES